MIKLMSSAALLQNIRRWTILASVATVLTACSATDNQPAAYRQTIPLEWGWGPTLPVVKSSYCTTAVDGDVVTVGGTYWERDDQGKPTKRWRNEVYRLSPGDKQWGRLPDFPHPIGYALAVAFDAKLYVIGGTKGPGEKDTLREVYVIDLSEDEPVWRHETDLPWPASRLRGGRAGQTILVAGTNHSDGGGTFTLEFDPDNPAAGWQQLNSPPHGRTSYFAGTTCGNKLYVFGGGSNAQNGIRLNAESYVLNPPASKWQKIKPLPVPMRDMTVSAIDGRYIFIVGGVEQAGKTAAGIDPIGQDILSSRVFCYDTQEDTYRAMDPLRLAVADSGIAAIPGSVFIVAGEDSVYQSRTGLVQVGRVQRLGTQAPEN